MPASGFNPPNANRDGTSTNNNPVPTSLAWGARGSGPANDREKAATGQGSTTRQDERQNVNVDAVDSMATLGEGDVADAVQRKSGTQLAPGQKREDVVFDDYAADLDRKKEEQADAREAIKQARREGKQVD